MNKKEKEFLENNLYFNYLRCLRTQADMKNDKSKQARIMANVAKFAAEHGNAVQEPERWKPDLRGHS